VRADAGRVQEIFTNLIDNAVKYTASGTITIKHHTEKQYLVTSVRDTGNGISAEHRERLFQRFYRVQTEETKGISGTGLGLWIIKQYIEHMGGKIEVDSLVGSGTEFIVYLPLGSNDSTK
jgi:signal transduction histidine kinase